MKRMILMVRLGSLIDKNVESGKEEGIYLGE